MTCNGTTQAVLTFGSILFFIDLVVLYYLAKTIYYWFVVGTILTVLNIRHTLLFIDLLISYCLSKTIYYWLVVVLPQQFSIFDVLYFLLTYWFYIVYPWKLIIDLLWYYPGSSQYSRYVLFIYLLILYYLFKTICYLLVVVLLWQFSILGAFYFLLIYWIYFDYPIQLAIEL